MLASKFILKGNDNFEKVEREGEIFQSETFGLAFLNRKDNDDSRFGFIISNKVCPDAANRNRIKRCIKESVRQNFADIKKGFDVVFLAKQKIVRSSSVQIMSEVKEALKAVGILG